MHPTLSTTQRGHLQRLCLTNGITLLVGQNAAVEILAAHCFFRGGSRVEQPQQAGLSQLLAAVLTKGTRQRDSQAIAAWVESLGASLSVDSAADHFEVALRCVAEDSGAVAVAGGDPPRSQLSRGRGGAGAGLDAASHSRPTGTAFQLGF